MNRPAVRYFLVISVSAFLQYTVLNQFRIAGVSADLLLVVAIAAGMNAGAERGAVVGFVSGLCLDLMVVTPFGLGAIAGLVAGVVAGRLEAATVHSARWLTMAIAFVSSGTGILAFVISGSLLGRSEMWSLRVLAVIAIVGISSALLVFPMVRACRWADPDDVLLRTAVR
jgi:rod shape-determining protein MreD